VKVGQPNQKRAAGARGTFDVDRTPVISDDMFDEAEPDARTANLRCSSIIDSIEFFEDTLLVGLSNADAAVLNHDADVLFMGRNENAHPAVGRAILDRVREEIDEDLEHRITIDTYGRQVVGNL